MRRWFALVAMLAAACETTRPAPRPPTPLVEAEPVGRYYTVTAGDTLFDIAKRFDLPAEEIAEVNGITKPDELALGQVLFLPDDDPLALPAVEPKPKPVLPPPSAHDGSLAWPLAGGVLIREFDDSRDIPYEGVAIAAPEGTPVVAAALGDVLYAGDEGTPQGTMLILRHSPELTTIYAHLAGVDVEVGDRVAAGQRIGRVGASGRAPSPRLHFQVREGRKAIDPLSRLPEP